MTEQRSNSKRDLSSAEATQLSLLRALFNGSDRLACAVDADLRLITCNIGYANEIASVFGAAPQSGESLLAFRPAFSQAAEELEALWRRALGGESFEVTHPWRGKCTRNFHSRFRPIVSEDGLPVGAYVFSQSVEDTKIAEDNLRLKSEIVSHIGEGLCLIRSSDGTVVYTNPKFEQIFGYSRQEIIGKPISVLDGGSGGFSHELAQRTAVHLKAFGTWEGEICQRRKGGAECWCHVSVSTFEHPSHGPVWIALFTDISDRKMAEHEVAEQRKTLREAAKMAALGEMAGGISHEINNPLTIISGMASEIHALVEPGSPRGKEIIGHCARIRATVDRIARIIQGLKSFARYSDGDAPKVVGVKAIIDETLGFCGGKLKHDGIRLTIDEIPPQAEIKCHPLQIGQLLINLLNNAIDAVHTLDEKWIRIEVKMQPDGILLCVSDSGPGISADIRTKIFHPFFSTKALGKGTGLGLSISHGIVEQHGGKITLDSSAAHTTFVVYLPKEPRKNTAGAQADDGERLFKAA